MVEVAPEAHGPLQSVVGDLQPAPSSYLLGAAIGELACLNMLNCSHYVQW